MANEYATLNELKAQLTIPVADTTRNDLLNRANEASARSIDTLCGRRFYADAAATARVYRTAASVLCDPDGEVLLVDDISSLAGLVVETGDGTTWAEVTDYTPEPHNALVQGRPVTRLRRDDSQWSYDRQVRVTAAWGWPTVPPEVKAANLIQAARLFRRKDSPEGVTGSAEWGMIRLSRIDPDVQALVSHLMLPGFG